VTILGKIKRALSPQCYPKIEFGLENIPFFVLLLRACPEGSRLTFDQSEPASFVVEFREWSHRSDVNSFEADYYTIDAGFIGLIEQLAAAGELELYSHFGIGSPRGGLICASWDEFTVVKLEKEIADKIRERLAAELNAVA
jgi:hypothetical protein